MLFIGLIIVTKWFLSIFFNVLSMKSKFLLGTSLAKQTIPPFVFDKGTDFSKISPISIILFFSSLGR